MLENVTQVLLVIKKETVEKILDKINLHKTSIIVNTKEITIDQDDQDQKNIIRLKNRNMFDIKMKPIMKEEDIKKEMKEIKEINITMLEKDMTYILQNMMILDIVQNDIKIIIKKINIMKSIILIINMINTI